jgi:hypothetical protein
MILGTDRELWRHPVKSLLTLSARQEPDGTATCRPTRRRCGCPPATTASNRCPAGDRTLCLGGYAQVRTPGRAARGDTVRMVDHDAS